MKAEIDWLKGALASKDIVINMSYYKITGNEIRATDGAIIASHPWAHPGEALVPGIELEKIVSRLTEEPTVKYNKESLTIKSGEFKALVPTVPNDEWAYPGIEGEWKALPEGLIEVLSALRPFVSDNATQPWANCVTLKNDWAYATNNVAVVGSPCKGIGKISLLVPSWAISFVIKRPGVVAWQHTGNYVAFQWDNGAWMRCQLVVGDFPPSGVKMVQEAFQNHPTQAIDAKFREAFTRLHGLIEEPLKIYKDKMCGKFRVANVEEAIECEVPVSRDYTLWSIEALAPVIQNATHWQPAAWPKPSSFKGENIYGAVVGRVV